MLPIYRESKTSYYWCALMSYHPPSSACDCHWLIQ